MIRPEIAPAWPFLVSTNATNGFTTIVTPPFLYEQGATDLLLTVTDGVVTPDDSVNLRLVAAGRLGTMVVAYRVAVAPGALVGVTEEILLDHQGRRILLIEGIVMQIGAGDAESLQFTQEDFDLVRDACRDAFVRAWHAETVLPPRLSEAIALTARGAAMQIASRSRISLSPAPRRTRSPARGDDSDPPVPLDPTSLILFLTVLGIGIVALLALVTRTFGHGLD
jgi:hypothetical protein